MITRNGKVERSSAGPKHGGTFHELLEVASRRHLGRIAVIAEGERVTYEALWNEVASLAERIEACKLESKSSRIAIQIKDPLLLLLWSLGVLKSGRAAVLLPQLDGLDADDLLTKARTDVIISDGVTFGSLAVATSVLADGISLSTTAKSARVRVADTNCDQAIVFFTSGTTGTPRPVLHHHSALIFAATRLHELQREFLSDSPWVLMRRVVRLLNRNPVAVLRAAKRQIWMTDLSPASIGGFTLICQSLYSGHTLVITDRHRPREIAEMIQRHRVSMFASVPAVIRALVSSTSLDQYRLSSLLVIGIGGGHVTDELAEATRAKFRCDVVVGYGSTELGGGVLVTSPGDSSQEGMSLGSHPVPGVVVSVRDAFSRECPIGTVGELWCKTPGRMAQYMDGEEEDSRTIKGSDWLRTHDLAVRRADDTIRIIGRSDHMILRGGRKISPYDVEQRLLQSEAIDEAVVAGIRELDGEDTIHAWVIPKTKDATTSTELRAWVSSRMPLWSIPRHIHFVSELPRTQAGEPLRKTLIEGQLRGLSPTGEHSPPPTPKR